MQEISFTLSKYGFTDLLKGIEKDKYNNFKKLGIDEAILKSDIFTKYIKSESVELFSLIHGNIAKGIIDMYSFKQEYDSFFNKNCVTNIGLKGRISEVKKRNKFYMDEIDWIEVKNLRNIILAHNLRDKKKQNCFASKKLTSFVNLALDFKKCLLYFSALTMIHQDIKKEFAQEYMKAFRETIY